MAGLRPCAGTHEATKSTHVSTQLGLWSVSHRFGRRSGTGRIVMGVVHFGVTSKDVESGSANSAGKSSGGRRISVSIRSINYTMPH